MKFEIPRMYQTIQFSDYAPEFGEAHLEVWVNPPQGMIDYWFECNSELVKLVQAKTDPLSEEQKKRIGELTQEHIRFYAEVLKSDGQIVNREDVKALFDSAQETDPMFTDWLVEQIMTAILNHRTQRKN